MSLNRTIKAKVVFKMKLFAETYQQLKWRKALHFMFFHVNEKRKG